MSDAVKIACVIWSLGDDNAKNNKDAVSFNEAYSIATDVHKVGVVSTMEVYKSYPSGCYEMTIVEYDDGTKLELVNRSVCDGGVIAIA